MYLEYCMQVDSLALFYCVIRKKKWQSVANEGKLWQTKANFEESKVLSLFEY